MGQGNDSMAQDIAYNSTTLHPSEYISCTTVKMIVINESFQEDNRDNILYITPTGASVTYGYFAICMITVVLAGWIIFLNGLVIHTLLYDKPHSDVTDYFVSSLSIADFITGILLLYMTSYSLAQFQYHWECLFRFGLTYTISQSSFSHILAITFDRYVKVIYPLRYFSMFTKRTVIITSVMIWSGSIIIGLLPLLGWNKELKLNDSGTVCRFFGILPDGYFIFNFLTSLMTSLGMLMLYVRIIHMANHQRKRMKGLMEGSEVSQAHLDDQTWRLVKTVAIIVLVSNLCWLPGGEYFFIAFTPTLLTDHIYSQVHEVLTVNKPNKRYKDVLPYSTYKLIVLHSKRWHQKGQLSRG